EKVLQELRPARDQSYHPLAQVAFVCRAATNSLADVSGLRICPMEVEPDRTRFDLRFECIDQGSELILNVEYATDLFAPDTISRLLAHWRRLLEGITDDPTQRLSELPMLTAAEEHTLLVEWGD